MKKQMILSAVSVLILCSCQPKLGNQPDADNNRRLNSLLTLKTGNDTVFLQDFVTKSDDIDSVTTTDKNLKCKIIDGKKIAVITADKGMKQFADMKLWVKGVPYSVPCRKTDKIDYVFTFNPQGKTYHRVQIAGQMNDWAPTLSPDLTLNSKGLYEVTLNISPGTYLYQMCLDGDQNHDPNNPNKVDNGYGKFNSILQVTGQNDKFPRLFSSSFTSQYIHLATQNEITDVFVYWQNYLLPEKFINITNGDIKIEIPGEASRLKRSFIRVWASNALGVSNDVLIPLDNGKVLDSPNQISRTDDQAQIMYFVLVDRFKNGNPENDHPLDSKEVNPKVDYWGGDLEGIKQVIDDGYFDRLGVNTLWISPVNQNPTKPYGYYAPMNTKFSGYHGYWPVSSSKVDFRFGSNNEFKNLVADAHNKDINVLLDYVAHHVHAEHPLYKAHPSFFTSLYLPDGTLNTERWNDHRLTTWFDTFMPTLDLANDTVVSMMTDSAMYWLREFNLDGFRHDACKHITEKFWRELVLKMKQQFPDKHIYQIGETYGSPNLIGSYLTTGMLNGQFDFNVFDEASTAFAGVGAGSLDRVMNVLQTSFRTYGYHNVMGYISGNHDKARFMAYASGDLKYGEDAKAAGWKRDIGITDSTAYSKMALLQTFNLTIPGVPVIFYGDEIGMTGANDPDCRRMMRFDKLNNREKELLKKVSVLTHLRKDNPVLVYGDFINIESNSDSWVYARKYFGNEAIVLINNSAEKKTLDVTLPSVLTQKEFRSVFFHRFSYQNHKLTIELPPYSADVLL